MLGSALTNLQNVSKRAVSEMLRRLRDRLKKAEKTERADISCTKIVWNRDLTYLYDFDVYWLWPKALK